MRLDDKEVPTLNAMGFRDHCSYSWPFHPFIKLFETHMESHFADYKDSYLDLKTPTNQTMEKRWRANKFRQFINKELRGLQLANYHYLPEEDIFFGEHPHLRVKWEATMAATVLRESKNDRFGKTKTDFSHQLKKHWLADRKYEFMMRWLGLRTNAKNRQSIRRKSLDYYSESLLYCRHVQCWYERIKWLPFLLLAYFLLQIYYHLNSKYFDIYVKPKTRRQYLRDNTGEGAQNQ